MTSLPLFKREPRRRNAKTSLAPFHVDKSPARQRYGTPWALYWELERRYGGGGFTLDPCAEPWSAKCDHFFTVDDDGLAQDWLVQNETGLLIPSRTFFNPPFDDIGAWMEKACREFHAKRAERVCALVPNRTEATWYHEIVKPWARVIDIEGRVNFLIPPELIGTEDEPSDANFEGSMVVLFEPTLRAADYRDPKPSITVEHALAPREDHGPNTP